MPYPYILSGKTARSPDRRTSSIISFAVSSGQACHRQATIPHIIGEEKEVPLAWRKLPVRSHYIRAQTYGNNIRLHPSVGRIPNRRERSQNSIFVHRTYGYHILRISRRRNLLPRTGPGVSRTAYYNDSLICRLRRLTGTSMHNVRSNHDSGNSSSGHQMNNTRETYLPNPLRHYRQIR